MKKLLLFGAISFGLNAFGQINNYSLEFDGLDKYVETPNIIAYDVTDFTVNFWFKQDTIISSVWQSPISKDCPGCEPTNGDWAFICIDGAISFAAQNTTSFNWGNVCTSQLVADSNWHYISGTRNGSTGILNLYVDGILVDTKTDFIGMINNTEPIYFAKYSITSQYTANFFIDGVEFWNVELDIQSIQDYMICPPTGNESGLVGYWNFEEGTGTTAGDLTSNGNDGTLTNGPTWSTDVPAYNCSGAGISELSSQDKELVKITNLFGQETEYKPNTPLIYIYSDGSTERVYSVE